MAAVTKTTEAGFNEGVETKLADGAGGAFCVNGLVGEAIEVLLWITLSSFFLLYCPPAGSASNEAMTPWSDAKDGLHSFILSATPCRPFTEQA